MVKGGFWSKIGKYCIRARCLLPKFCITIIFDFSWYDCNTLETLDRMIMQTFGGEGGVNKMHYGQCKTGEFKGCWKLKYGGNN